VNKIKMYGVFVLCAVLFQGCGIVLPFSSQNAEPYKPQPSSENSNLTKLVGKNYIKGIVTSLKRDANANVWNYQIEGIDTSNGKLPFVNFNHKNVVANEGDLVHASFDGMRMSEMLVIKAGYFKNGKRQEVVPTKKPSAKESGKRDKSHQILKVPEEEYIKLK
jgi:hypothetical protein